MSKQAKFHELSEQNLSTLKLYVPIVARVHGDQHPEFHEVKKAFDALCLKIEAAGAALPDAAGEFAALREITGGYNVPADTCETYEAVYKMLGEMDAAFHRDA